MSSAARQSVPCTAFFAFSTPDLIILSTEYPNEKDMLGVGACVQNILLAATEKGYGTCVIGELYSAELDILGIRHNDYKLICGISIGESNIKDDNFTAKELDDFLILV